MKLRKLTIDGLRGFPRSLELSLNGKSVSILGENGFGKTTIADAVDLWSNGDLENYHRAGALLDAAISVNAERAVVTVQPEGHPAFRRTLEGRRVAPIEVRGPHGDVDVTPPGPIPLLRHRTMSEFMGFSAGEKKKALLELLGLQDLTAFRAAVASAARQASARVKAAHRELVDAQQALEQAGGEVGVAAKCSELSRRARLPEVIATEQALRETKLPTVPALASDPRPTLLQQVETHAGGIDNGAVDDWNTAIADHDLAREQGLRMLLDAGRDALRDWDQDSCPLCLVEQDRDELVARITSRSAALAQATRALEPRRLALKTHRDALESTARALVALRDAPPPGGWANAEPLSHVLDGLESARAIVDRGLQVTGPCDRTLATGISELIEAMQLEIAAVGSDTRPAEALVELAALQARSRAVVGHEQHFEAEETISLAVKSFVDIADAEINATVEAQLGGMSALVARYYGRLHGGPYYSNVRLVYTPARDGGVEFTFEFAGRDVSPPQRIMSESQLNSLGLSLFLARLHYDESGWRTLVLDDVVNSFDANHRSGLARLLREDFSDWQVVMLTHDRIFHRVLELETTNWSFQEITQWDPVGGPVMAAGDPVFRLQTELESGKSAAELHGLARRALESDLEIPVSKLGLNINYKANAAYTAADYLKALRSTFSRVDDGTEILEALDAIAGRTYMANLGSHLRPNAPALSTGDMRQLIEDLLEFRAQLECDDCGKKVWYAQRANRSGHYHCQCEKLAV